MTNYRLTLLLLAAICWLICDMEVGMKELDPEYSKVVDDHFWELF